LSRAKSFLSPPELYLEVAVHYRKTSEWLATREMIMKLHFCGDVLDSESPSIRTNTVVLDIAAAKKIHM
jgi:hypothetical protein